MVALTVLPPPPRAAVGPAPFAPVPAAPGQAGGAPARSVAAPAPEDARAARVAQLRAERAALGPDVKKWVAMEASSEYLHLNLVNCVPATGGGLLAGAGAITTGVMVGMGLKHGITALVAVGASVGPAMILVGLGFLAYYTCVTPPKMEAAMKRYRDICGEIGWDD